MRLSITQNDDRCPAGLPWSLEDLDTLQILGCHKSSIDAIRHKELIEDGERGMDDDPDIAFGGPVSIGDVGDFDEGLEDLDEPIDLDDPEFDAPRRVFQLGFTAGYRQAYRDMALMRAAGDGGDEVPEDEDETEEEPPDDAAIGEGPSGVRPDLTLPADDDLPPPLAVPWQSEPGEIPKPSTTPFAQVWNPSDRATGKANR
jgi:hypothetical protein